MSSLIWNGSTPTSKIFDDIYFSPEDGIAETNHVFLEGNKLPSRWQGYKGDFTICETGFGTGLNFFCAYNLWKELNCTGTLNFISVEKFPLDKNDIKKAISIWPEFEAALGGLLGQYPSPDIKLPNCSLKIYFEDVKTALPKITVSADAWFLDGFAPSKNPDMWCDELFANMARLTNENGTFATFTAAGFVKRALRDNGFTVEKTRGFGSKRDMLVGQFITNY